MRWVPRLCLTSNIALCSNPNLQIPIGTQTALPTMILNSQHFDYLANKTYYPNIPLEDNTQQHQTQVFSVVACPSLVKPPGSAAVPSHRLAEHQALAGP